MSDMPREEVERLIRESGMSIHLGMPHEAVIEQMTRFANMLRDEMLESAEHAIQCAMEFEREACAKVCESGLIIEYQVFDCNKPMIDIIGQGADAGVKAAAAAIRARGEK
jgi:hypothetical protein